MASRPIRAGLILLGLGILLSGCSLILPAPEQNEPIAAPQLPPTPEPLPVEIDTPPVEPAPPPVVKMPEPVTPPPPETFAPRVAIVLSARVPAYENVATELGGMLENFDLYDLSDRSLTQKEAFDNIRGSGTEVIVAVGLRAASFASVFDDLPVVFSQVFNVSEIDARGENFKGVAVIPPLDLQLEAWRKLNPDIRTVGAILGEGHDLLVEEAKRATEASGMRLQYRLAQSDRETLYLFTRLVPEIDGFWLFPDNRILSSTILKQMLDYASRHGVQVAVFNDSLLPLGAAISATSLESDIAATIVSVLHGLMQGDTDAIPAITPLSKIEVRTNVRAAEQVAKSRDGDAGEAH